MAEKVQVNADKLKVLNAVMEKIEKDFGKGSIMRMNSQEVNDVPVIPTGSITLDMALGVGGYPKGRVVEIYGPESSGKTTLAIHAIAEAQKAGGIAAFIDAEHAFDSFYAQKLGVDVYAVSTDTHFTHKAWHSSSETIAKIKYAMIGDPTGALTRNFDNMREDEGLADRATFVVDPQGIIQAIEVTAEGIGRDASDLLRKIKAAQYVASHPGEVCPAKWKEGEATLAPSLDLVGKI